MSDFRSAVVAKMMSRLDDDETESKAIDGYFRQQKAKTGIVLGKAVTEIATFRSNLNDSDADANATAITALDKIMSKLADVDF